MLRKSTELKKPNPKNKFANCEYDFGSNMSVLVLVAKDNRNQIKQQ
ncbi:MAG: hypothetical protein RR338_01800 [Clostridia bacterium]